MTNLITEAQSYVAVINQLMIGAGLKYRAAVDVRDVNVPGVLVVPTPRRDYQPVAGGGYAIAYTWSIYAISHQPADLDSMRHLDAMAEQIEKLDGAVSAVPASYLIPGLAAEPLPAYQFTFDGGSL